MSSIIEVKRDYCFHLLDYFIFTYIQIKFRSEKRWERVIIIWAKCFHFYKEIWFSKRFRTRGHEHR